MFVFCHRKTQNRPNWVWMNETNENNEKKKWTKLIVRYTILSHWASISITMCVCITRCWTIKLFVGRAMFHMMARRCMIFTAIVAIVHCTCIVRWCCCIGYVIIGHITCGVVAWAMIYWWCVGIVVVAVWIIVWVFFTVFNVLFVFFFVFVFFVVLQNFSRISCVCTCLCMCIGFFRILMVVLWARNLKWESISGGKGKKKKCISFVSTF